MNYLPGILLIVLGVTWIVTCVARDWRNAPPEPEPEIEIHVTYNSITNGQSKYTVGDPPRSWMIVGEKDGALYRCRVSQEFWEALSENTHVTIPESQCLRINPVADSEQKEIN